MTESRRLPDLRTQPITSATATTVGRIFLLDSPRYTKKAPPFLAADHSGLVLSGKGSNAMATAIGRQSNICLVPPDD
jgi:hypothetical protein